MSCAAKRNDVDAKLVQACRAFVPAPDTTHFPVVALFVTLSIFAPLSASAPFFPALS